MSEVFKICIDKDLPDELKESATIKAIEENPANNPYYAVSSTNVSTNETVSPEIVGERLKFWKPGRTLRIKFLDGIPEIQEKVKKYAMTWTKYANIKFKFVQSGDAEIRISFKEKGSWSYIGTDCLSIPRHRPTMNFGWFTLEEPRTTDEEYSRTVIHEFGHALGLHHEHMHPEGGIPWNKEAVYRDYMRCEDPEDPCWTKEDVDNNLFDKLNRTLMNYSVYDKDSIMHYPILKRHTFGGYEVGLNTRLSELDKQFIKKFYPPNPESIPEKISLIQTGEMNESFGENIKLDKNIKELQNSFAQERYIERSSEREHTLSMLENKNILEISKPERVELRKKIINPRDGLALERLIGKSDIFPISYLEAGLEAAKPICRIEIRDKIGRILGHGTGFLVSPTLLLTNNHVLNNEELALFSLAQFNYEINLNNTERETKNFRLDPKRLFITDKILDFTLVAVEEVSADGTHLDNFGFLPLLPQKDKILKGEHVSIIQHPCGAPKAISLRANKVMDILDDYIHYETDTDEGSSGSAVFNDQWIVVALHHAGVRDPNNREHFIANEGVRISSILQLIKRNYQSLNNEQKLLIDNLLKGSEGILSNKAESLNQEWHHASTGYDSKFLGEGYEVLHPKFQLDLEDDIARQENGDMILNYTHFSIVMSKKRRLAYYTVVNIDGNKPRSARRERNWKYDPRISTQYQCGDELYDDNDIDKGHLVRRQDPIWGDSAEEANKDTFYFTNCSPQHKEFNQKIWLGLEDYILKNTKESHLKVNVFTGPIFRSDDIFYRGVQIPAEFWKLVVMVKEDGNLSATAYLQSQKNLIDDLEFAFGEYKTYQISISKIENLTGLDFGELRNHDPLDGLEFTNGHIIESYEDINF
ncbi:DNA/RNA non-specific endonuclease [Bacillus toyonensis]|nr:DNA/RNA non-specific endonuclease [Bacillus toyonensis]